MDLKWCSYSPAVSVFGWHLELGLVIDGSDERRVHLCSFVVSVLSESGTTSKTGEGVAGAAEAGLTVVMVAFVVWRALFVLWLRCL